MCVYVYVCMCMYICIGCNIMHVLGSVGVDELVVCVCERERESARELVCVCVCVCVCVNGHARACSPLPAYPARLNTIFDNPPLTVHL